MILSDRDIIERVEREQMIEPFVRQQVGDGVVSYGLSSYGYDFRVATEFKIFTPVYMPVIDPKNFNPQSFVDVEAPENEAVIIPPNSFALARTVEYFRIPRDILCLCLGKSTYARMGIILNTTPFEPGWEGYATLEISNTTPLPAKIYAAEGIGQVIFLRARRECLVSYADRKGKYQRQQGIVLPRVD
jgi:dCTP deaminase